MTDSGEDEIHNIDCSDDDETEECMEFQIGLMIEPQTNEISIVTPNGNRPISHLSVAPSTNNYVCRKRKLDSEEAHPSKRINSPYTITPATTSITKTHPPNVSLDTATILSAINNLRELITQVATKTDEMYKDFQEIKKQQNTWQESSMLDRTSLCIPFATKEELISFDEKLKTDDVPRRLLRQFLLKLDDRTWDRYTGRCLAACFKIELAVLCSFYGKNNNIEVQHLEVIAMIRECAEERFPTVRLGDINATIVRWFHLATDRYKKRSKKVMP